MTKNSNSLNQYKDKVKIGDYPLFCDTCGSKMWFSESKTLGKYTGLEGSQVCKDCVDGRVETFVPFTIKPEKTPKVVRNSLSEDYPAASTINFNTSPPTVEE